MKRSLSLSAQLSQLSRDGEVYHHYCLNYAKAVNYLENLRKNDDWIDFEKVGTLRGSGLVPHQC